MTWMITGAGGQAGRSLQDALAQSRKRIIALSSNALDITNEAMLQRVLSTSQPDVIFNCAAYTHIRDAERNAERAHAVNATAPAALARWCADNDAWLIHLSNDYVFSGTAKEPYCEYALPGPLSVYGKSKLSGEQAVMDICPRTIVVRTGWLFSAYGNNFLKRLIDQATCSNSLSVMAERRGSPTPADSLADALIMIATLAEQGKVKSGRYHFAGLPATDCYQFAREVLLKAQDSGVIGHECRLTNGQTTDSETPDPHLLNSVLISHKLTELGIASPDWRAGISRVIAKVYGSERQSFPDIRSYTTKL